MLFVETALAGVFVLELEVHADGRGFFARSFCQREFEAHGLERVVAQGGIAFNHRRGTVRGMHFQYPPAAEAKLVRCTRGALLDVIVDLRPESATFLRHVAVELTADNRRGLYIPPRFAHGYQTLADATEATYQLSEFHAPDLADGLASDDPALGISWPLPVSEISDRDRAWPRLRDAEATLRARMTQSIAAGR
jgi:dTDP-4-dehydrorhamnose 3,5-epimerase